MVLSHTAYGTEFPEQSPTRSMNHFIRENSERLQGLFEQIANVGDLDEVMRTLIPRESVAEFATLPGCLTMLDLHTLHSVLWTHNLINVCFVSISLPIVTDFLSSRKTSPRISRSS